MIPNIDWNEFKRQNPTEANEIESFADRDLSKCSSADVSEIIFTVNRLTEKEHCSISTIKENYIEYIGLQLMTMDYDEFIAMSKNYREKEARLYNISLDNTVSGFMMQWAHEIHQKQKEENMLKRLVENMSFPSEVERNDYIRKIQETHKSLNLAPDISGFDRIENRLIALAEDGVEFISDNYKGLSHIGQIEALLYCTTCLIDLPTNYKNALDLDVKEDRYFLLLVNKIHGIKNKVEFINHRIDFYNNEKRKLTDNLHYTTIAIYNAFYVNPLNEHPECIGDMQLNESSLGDLVLLECVLKQLDRFLQAKKLEIR